MSVESEYDEQKKEKDEQERKAEEERQKEKEAAEERERLRREEDARQAEICVSLGKLLSSLVERTIRPHEFKKFRLKITEPERVGPSIRVQGELTVIPYVASLSITQCTAYVEELWFDRSQHKDRMWLPEFNHKHPTGPFIEVIEKRIAYKAREIVWVVCCWTGEPKDEKKYSISENNRPMDYMPLMGTQECKKSLKKAVARQLVAEGQSEEEFNALHRRVRDFNRRQWWVRNRGSTIFWIVAFLCLGAFSLFQCSAF